MENKTNMWDRSLDGVPAMKRDKIDIEYLSLIALVEPGFCGRFRMEYISNRHKTLTIKAVVRTTAWYRGNIVNEESKTITVPPGGQANAVRLGCTGWDNPTGADDTEYRRNIDGVAS